MSNPQGKEQIITTNPAILANLRSMVTPVDRKELNEIQRVNQMDAVQFLSMFPDESVDLVLTDEPFGSAKTFIEVEGRDSPVMDTDFDWDTDMPASALMPWVLESYRILKPGGGIINCGFSEWGTLFKDICLDAGFYWKATIRVIVSNPRPQVRKRNYRNGHYDIWWASKGVPGTFNFLEQQEMRNWIGETTCPNCGSGVPMVISNAYDVPGWIFNAKTVPGIWSEFGPLTQDNREHPTQKSEWLAVKILSIHTNSGDVVVDPFCGSGTFGYIAKCLGRTSYNNDKEEKWSRYTQERLSALQPFFN